MLESVEKGEQHTSGTTEAHDEAMMQLALQQAERALALNEVPIGAVIIDETGHVIGEGHNLRETESDPTAHAEIVAIKRAAQSIGSWRLTNCTLYVTIEPCPMCAGAIVNARLQRVVYGAADPKAGAVHSLYELLSDTRLNHRLETTAGVLQSQCGAMMQSFFQRLRQKK